MTRDQQLLLALGGQAEVLSLEVGQTLKGQSSTEDLSDALSWVIAAAELLHIEQDRKRIEELKEFYVWLYTPEWKSCC